MSAEITVVIPFYNPGRYIVEAINSVLKQSFDRWKILLINDGSTDHSVSFVQKYFTDRRISLVQHPENLNLSKSLNTALRIVDTPYMLHLDGDDYLYPNALELLYKEAIKLAEDVAVISGNINLVIENKRGKIVREKPKYGRLFTDRYEFLKANMTVWPRFYRTDALRQVGGWPTDDPYEGEFVEDLSILFRLIERYRFHWIDKPLLHHRRHYSNQTNHTDLLADSVEWIIRDTLKHWGDQFEPVFRTDEEGWRMVDHLVPK